MNEEKLREAFLQGGEREASEVFNELMRSSVRAALWEMMSSEVESLCGPKYHPKAEGEYRRGGSEQGSVYLDGGKESVKRPRVRHVEDGEVELESYRAASSQSGLFEEVVGLVAEGMSQRGLGRVKKDAISKSAISRMWEEKSREQLAMVRERELKGTDWLAVMIDGVFIGGENCVVIALGIEASGRKQVLYFEVGSSESRESVERLIGSLERRGVHSSGQKPLLVVRDGSAAIKGAVSRVWPSARQQVCLIHLERNIADRLRQRDRAESQRLFGRLRQAQGKAAGEEAFEDLREFVAERNGAAALLLAERRDEALTLHRLEVPATLNVTLLSTNAIENVIRNWREATGNVKRWDVRGDMIERWSASGLLWAENGFRRIRHAEDLPQLREALTRSQPEPISAAASTLRSESYAPIASGCEMPTCPELQPTP